jgi:hypothetical protein
VPPLRKTLIKGIREGEKKSKSKQKTTPESAKHTMRSPKRRNHVT